MESLTAPFDPQPILQTERLILRPMALDDTDFVFRHFSDPDVTRHLLDEPSLTEYAGAEEIVRYYLQPETKNHCRWVLIHRADGQTIGTCGYHKWERQHLRAEIGYDLSPAFWGQGYMTEALAAVIRHGFGCMRLHRIDALVYVGNHRSDRLLRRLGFKQEGVLRDYYRRDGKYYDHLLFALLREEWKD